MYMIMYIIAARNLAKGFFLADTSYVIRSHQLLGANFHAAFPQLANVQNVCQINIMFSINQLIYGHLKRVGQATCTSEGPFLPAQCLQ